MHEKTHRTPRDLSRGEPLLSDLADPARHLGRPPAVKLPAAIAAGLVLVAWRLAGVAVGAEPAPQLREWLDDTGEHTVRAALVAAAEDRVTLRKEDGATIVVPLGRLSEADREWVELESLSPDERAYRAEADRQRIVAMHETEDEVAKLKAELKKESRAPRRVGATPYAHTPDGRAVVKKIKAAEEKLRRLKRDPAAFRPEIDPLRLGPGSAGFLALPRSGDVVSGHFEVLQVIDDDELIAVCCHRTDYLVNAGTGNQYGQVALVRRPVPPQREPLLWIEGVSTAGRTDGSRLEPGGPFLVVGTKTYEAVTGASRTVWHLRQISIDGEH